MAAAVTVREAEFDDRGRLRRLLTDYLFEFDGRREPYPYFDSYWGEPEPGVNLNACPS